MMMNQAIVASLLLLATITFTSALVLEKTTEEERKARRRERLLKRTAPHMQGERELDPHLHLSHYGERMALYQMDISAGPDHSSDASSVTQPYTHPKANGAEGELIYSPYGWDFLFTLLATGLPSGTPYQLVYYPDSADAMSDMVCLGTGTVSRFGGLYIAGNVPLTSSLPVASDKNKGKGAKMWLVPAGDINCSGSIKVMSETRDDNRYMFAGKHEYVNFDFLGD